MSSSESSELEFIHDIQSGLLMRQAPGEALSVDGKHLRKHWVQYEGGLWEGGERVDSESFPQQAGDARVRPGSAPPPSFLPPPLQTRQRHPRPSCPRGDKELAGRAGGSGD